MMKTTLLNLTFLVAVVTCISCGSSLKSAQTNEKAGNSISGDLTNRVVVPGADQLALYLPQLKGKKVGVMGNQTSIVGADKKHLVDVLMDNKVDLKFAFAPEHGFRGKVERGEKFG
ncbi:MAG: exo-beta-N-acetylmuramidase NamZ domain-containing protein, partial [Sphingobacterium paramultivorum]